MAIPGTANVRSLEAIRDFRNALAQFEERAGAGVGSLRLEINRILEWLEHDRPGYWKRQMHISYDRVAAARTALENCRRRGYGDHRPTCIDEEKALRRAQQRVRLTQEKIDAARHWSVKARQEHEEFRGRIGPFERAVEGDVPRMIALLTNMIDALEAYAEIAPTQPTVTEAEQTSSSVVRGPWSVAEDNAPPTADAPPTTDH